MTKPIGSIEWASDLTALKSEPTTAQKNFGWSTSDDTIDGIPVKPNLQNQNGWQYNVYQLLNWLNGQTSYLIAANNSSTADKALADIICGSGSNEITIKSICDTAVASNRKTVVLLPGTYVLGDALILDSHDDLRLIGLGVVRFQSSVDLTGEAGIQIDSDRVELKNIRFADGLSTKFEWGLQLTGDQLKVSEIIFETDSIKGKQSDSPAFALRVICTNSYIEARFETTCVENTGSNSNSYMTAVQFTDPTAVHNKCRFHFEYRPLYNANDTNPYYDNARYIQRTALYTTFNDITTNWIDMLGDAPDPANAPTGYTVTQDQFRWVGGNFEVMFREYWTSAGGAFEYYHVPPPNMILELYNQMTVDFSGTLVTPGLGFPYIVGNTHAGPVQSNVANQVFGIGANGINLWGGLAASLQWNDFAIVPTRMFGPVTPIHFPLMGIVTP